MISNRMADISIGTTIGGYQILEEIGQGGMASVYRAHQLSMDRNVAIKVLPPQFLHQTASLDRFKQEASIVSRLEHRAIVPVHDYGEYEGIPYIVMRCMEGGSVDDLLSKGPIPTEQTLRILDQIAPALDYAHREEVLHRDLKPSNILLDSNGDAYITDFGIARILSSNTKPLTTSGVVGTPSYMSPEQAQGHPLDGRSDVYALGVVVFEMLTGIRPFEGETPYSVAVKHVTEPPPSASQVNPNLPHAVDQVLFKALEKNRDQRYQTAAALAEALRKAVEQPSGAGGMTQTEPSLTEKLRASAMRLGIDTSRPVTPSPITSTGPVVDLRESPSNLQVMSPYVPSVSSSYPGVQVRPRRRQKSSRLPSWLTWLTLGLLVGTVLVALTIAAVYYVLNDTSGGTPPQADYNATAIFKMTATKQGIQTSEGHAVLTSPAALPGPTATPRILPTNTHRPTLSLSSPVPTPTKTGDSQ